MFNKGVGSISKMMGLTRGIFFLLLVFTPCKAEQPPRGMELKKKKHKKVKAYRKSI